MRRPLRLAIVAILLLAVVPALRADFHELARQIERLDHVERVGIPGFGLARFLVRLTHPEGVTDLKVAVFEQKRTRLAIDYSGFVKNEIGNGWTPIVVARSRGGEQSYIYARESRGRIRMMILAVDSEEVALIEMEMEPERFLRSLEEPGAIASTIRH
ncbi:MAG TPA: hypothetical protein VM534_09575 [Thermoanaerobaculia bacterium]|nr:hypothetical protein [Thermoanaerobaculia bacterium]